MTWVRGRHVLQMGGDVSSVHDYIDALSNVEGTFRYDSGATNGQAGGLVDWITDYTFNVHAYPNGGCPSIVRRCMISVFARIRRALGSRRWRSIRRSGLGLSRIIGGWGRG